MSQPTPGVSKRLRFWLEAAGLRLGVAIVGLLPYRWLRPMGRCFAWVVYRLDSRGRKVALSNLQCAFPGRFDDRQLRRMAEASYATFARTMLELLWAPRLNEKIYRSIVQIEGKEKHACFTDPSVPALFFCMHASNFEWLSLGGVYEAGAGLVLAQKLRNPRIGPVFDSLRSATGHEIIPQERAVLRMLKWLRAGGKFFMLNDLNIDPREGGVLIDAFGMKMCVTPAHAAIAQKTGAELIPCACIPKADGGYRFLVLDAIPYEKDEPVQPIVQRCWDALEPIVRENPEYWLWSYKHWRFRPSDADASRYPFYANTASRFDKLLK